MIRSATTSAFLLLLAVLFAAAPASLQARQTTVRGFVTDAESEQALQGATVVLTQEGGAFFGTATDGDGYFILNRIPSC